MEKPPLHQHRYYHYGECRDYLQARDGYDETDYAGKWTGPTPGARPYRNFWHFVLDHEPGLSNDSFFTMCEWWGHDAEPWQQEILDKYLSTFGTTDPQTHERSVEFYVSW